MRYIAELERKVQALQTEATSSIIQLILLKRETNARTAEISELKLRLQTMEQRVHFQEGHKFDIFSLKFSLFYPGLCSIGRCAKGGDSTTQSANWSRHSKCWTYDELSSIHGK
ncbi:hypothetical protein K7X08_027768 [Anisodus acutangulus]|uniref:Uncharacterized protein n=1 Tax=Anisodus acutangulus TaxID=402998 RepID=A0A9Q1LNA8_9SOLA|nr:hypothetical protein K7X08_027768 [Anisodus acutangulus]